MKLIVLADVHGNFNKLSEVVDAIDKKTIRGADAVICPGDFTDMFSSFIDFSQMEKADMVLQRILSLGKPTLCVPGNHDPYEIITLFEEYGTNLHAKKRSVSGYGLIGWGGAVTPFDTLFEPPEEETKAALEALNKGRKEKDSILVIHNPPMGTKLDVVQTGEHVGSNAIREFIEETQPLLAISAHVHEAEGMDKLGRTTLFNPGPVFQGNYGIVEISENGVECRIKKIS